MESVCSAVVLSDPWVDESPTVVADIFPSLTAEDCSLLVADSFVTVGGCEGFISCKALVAATIFLTDAFIFVLSLSGFFSPILNVVIPSVGG